MKKPVFFIIASAIFFLTGCAASGYHDHQDTRVIVDPAPLGPGSFLKPLSGSQTFLGFGSKEEGVSLKGAVLQSDQQGPVLASQAGRVVFVDEKLPGYGKTIIIQHADQFTTVYSRNSEILVKLNDIVKAGQTIARPGKSEMNGLSQIYLEIRKKSKAENPDLYLSPNF